MHTTVKSLMGNNYLRIVVISLRQGKIYASAQVPTVGPEPDTWGPHISVEPVFVDVPTVSAIAQVLHDSLVVALSYNEPLPMNARDAISPFPAKAGVKNEKQFSQGESVCFLFFFPDRIDVEHWKPQPKSHGFDGDGETVLPADSTFEQVAEVVLASLQDPAHIRPITVKKKK